MHCYRNQVFFKYVRRHLLNFNCKEHLLSIKEQEFRDKTEIEER